MAAANASPPMNIAQLDALLERLGQAERAVSGNLVELEEQPTYKLLQPATLVGVSAHRVVPALAALAELWRQFGLLRDLLERARALRGNDRDLSGAKRRELQTLLTGPSITLAVNQVPLAQRDLLGEAQTDHTITPAALLDAMTRAFDAARDAVFAVDAVWRDTVPRLDLAGRRASELERQVAAIGLAPADVAEVGALRACADRLTAAIGDDPLGVQADVDAQLGGSLAAAEAAVADLVRQHGTLSADFARASAETEEVARLVAAGAAALAETTAKITAPTGLLQPLGPDVIEAERDGLRPWLARLVAISGQGDWRVARKGLDQFLQISGARLAAARRIVAANRAPLQRRNELRGLLDAYQAKAAAKGLAEDDEQAARYRAAYDALHVAPCELSAAEALVAAYGRGSGAGVRFEEDGPQLQPSGPSAAGPSEPGPRS